jgi:dTDP-4-amino-4,6-dideoxygalactose transaminase
MIPFIKTYTSKHSVQNVNNLFAQENQASRGTYSGTCENLLSDLHKGATVFLTPSCSDALEMASQLIDLGDKDEVILPSYNFTSGANAIANFGALPVFTDIDSSLCIDLSQIKKKITKNTKAISWVNYGGQAPDFTQLRELATNNNLVLIEDNAHSLGIMSGETLLGTVGDFSTLSFHYTKNIQCGEGGALIINNPIYIDRAHKIYEKGTNRHEFNSGIVSKYRWVEKGSSYVLSEFSAAILAGQLHERIAINQMRREVIQKYRKFFDQHQEMSAERFSRKMEDQFERAAHMFPLLISKGKNRDRVSSRLKELGIIAVSHYESLHSSPRGLFYEQQRDNSKCNQDKKDSSFGKSNLISNSILRLPLWPGMTENEVEEVGSTVLNVLKN